MTTEELISWLETEVSDLKAEGGYERIALRLSIVAKRLRELSDEASDHCDAMLIASMSGHQQGKEWMIRELGKIIAPGQDMDEATLFRWVRELHAAQQWQPIEEAPREGLIVAEYIRDGCKSYSVKNGFTKDEAGNQPVRFIPLHVEQKEGER